MEIATSLARTCRLALIGAAIAFAWIVLSLFVGVGSSDAHAEETDGDNGLLGAVTSLVDATASGVTQTVTAVSGSVSATVSAVVEVAPAPAQAPVHEVVTTVSTVATAVTTPVAEALGGGVVSAVVQPTVDVVSGVPLVGDVVTGLGLGRALTDLSVTLDTGLDSTLTTVAAITDPLVAVPGIPGLIPAWSLALVPTDDLVNAALDTRSRIASASVVAARAPALWAGRAAPAVIDSTATLHSSEPLFTAGLCLPSSTSSGPAGAGSGAWALVAMVPLAAHRAWMRRAGPSDDLVPPAPAQSTDVSPD